MRSVPQRPDKAEHPHDRDAAVPDIAVCPPLPQVVAPGLIMVQSSASNPLYPEKSVLGRFREPFIPIRDIAFGGEVADEERLSFVRNIIASRADDDPALAVFDQEMIVEIGKV